MKEMEEIKVKVYKRPGTRGLRGKIFWRIELVWRRKDDKEKTSDK